MTTELELRDEAILAGSPQERVAQAVEIAAALSPIIEDRRLYTTIQGKRHVLYEGWTTLGALVGVVPVTAWTRPIEGGWEARVEARTLAGAIVGAAEAECCRAEARWREADDYAIRSMAQTRAGSKALRMPLGFIVHLSGFEATPAEEMPPVTKKPEDGGPELQNPAAPACVCGLTRELVSGSTNGRDWQGYFCPAKCSPPQFVHDGVVEPPKLRQQAPVPKRVPPLDWDQQP